MTTANCFAVVPTADSCIEEVVAEDEVFYDGFESSFNPSLGQGGPFPGGQVVTFNVPNVGQRTYYLYVPNSYSEQQAMPLMIVWHGAVLNPNSEAIVTRDNWVNTADQGEFIVLAQVASGQNSWIPALDEYVLFAILDNVTSLYNIEQNRIYAWGFSAGGHVMHHVALKNSQVFAAYGASAGVLNAFNGAFQAQDATRKIPVDLHIGNSDPLLQNVEDSYDEFVNNGWQQGDNLFYTLFVGGHNYTETHLEEIWTNLCPHYVTN